MGWACNDCRNNRSIVLLDVLFKTRSATEGLGHKYGIEGEHTFCNFDTGDCEPCCRLFYNRPI